MPWFKVDDGLAFHSKVVAAGNSAMGLWVRAGSWAAQQLTEGFVPTHIISILGTESQAARLVRSGLWTSVPGGFSFHEWEERQPKKETILAEKSAARERMRVIRARKKGTNPDAPLVNGHSSPEVREPVRNVFGNPVPSRPVPTSKEVEQSEPRKRGQRLPADFIPSETARAAILTECPQVDIRREHAKFVDHWNSTPGARGVKLDWDATWRNWMRRAAEQQPANGKSRRQQETDDLFDRAAQRMGVTNQTSIEGATA